MKRLRYNKDKHIPKHRGVFLGMFSTNKKTLFNLQIKNKMNELSNKDRLILKAFAWYQMAGGILGLGLTLWLISLVGTFTGRKILLFAIVIGFNSFSIYCGLLLRRVQIRKGLNLSIINQILQIIHFVMFGFGFSYVSGIMLYFGFDYTTTIKGLFNLSFSGVQLLYNQDKDVFIFGINVFAIYFVYLMKKIKTKIELTSIQSTEVQSST